MLWVKSDKKPQVRDNEGIQCVISINNLIYTRLRCLLMTNTTYIIYKSYLI